MKKISLALLAGAILSTASIANPFQGFYAGAAAGFTKNNTKAKSALQRGTSNASENKTFSKTGANLELFSGYGWVVASHLYLGAEANVGIDTASGNNRSGLNSMPGNSINAKHKSGFVYGVSGRMGAIFGGSTMIYGRLGYQGNTGKVETRLNEGNSSKTSRSGFVMGAGVDHYLNKKWFARAEYRYVLGSRKTSALSAGTLFSTTKVKNTSHTFLLGVGYKF